MFAPSSKCREPRRALVKATCTGANHRRYGLRSRCQRRARNRCRRAGGRLETGHRNRHRRPFLAHSARRQQPDHNLHRLYAARSESQALARHHPKRRQPLARRGSCCGLWQDEETRPNGCHLLGKGVGRSSGWRCFGRTRPRGQGGRAICAPKLGPTGRRTRHLGARGRLG